MRDASNFLLLRLSTVKSPTVNFTRKNERGLIKYLKSLRRCTFCFTWVGEDWSVHLSKCLVDHLSFFFFFNPTRHCLRIIFVFYIRLYGYDIKFVAVFFYAWLKSDKTVYLIIQKSVLWFALNLLKRDNQPSSRIFI